jgi:hypothetical protein
MPRVCAVVTASPVASPIGTELRTVHYRRLLWAGDAWLHVYRVASPGCPLR